MGRIIWALIGKLGGSEIGTDLLSSDAGVQGETEVLKWHWTHLLGAGRAKTRNESSRFSLYVQKNFSLKTYLFYLKIIDTERRRDRKREKVKESEKDPPSTGSFSKELQHPELG